MHVNIYIVAIASHDGVNPLTSTSLSGATHTKMIIRGDPNFSLSLSGLTLLSFSPSIAYSPLLAAMLLTGFGTAGNMWDENGPGILMWYILYTIPMGALCAVVGLILALVGRCAVAKRVFDCSERNDDLITQRELSNRRRAVILLLVGPVLTAVTLLTGGIFSEAVTVVPLVGLIASIAGTVLLRRGPRPLQHTHLREADGLSDEAPAMAANVVAIPVQTQPVPPASLPVAPSSAWHGEGASAPPSAQPAVGSAPSVA